MAGANTLLTSRWKVGKTTLLAGLAVEKAGAVVVTEESADHWHGRPAAAPSSSSPPSPPRRR